MPYCGRNEFELIRIEDIMLIIEICLIYGLSMLMHELGHAFFRYLFGQKMAKIQLGDKYKIINIGKVEIYSNFFSYGQCFYKNKIDMNKFCEIICISGGVIFNILISGFIAILMKNIEGYCKQLLYVTFIINMWLFIFNLIPQRLKDGYTDGGHIYNILCNKDKKLSINPGEKIK